MNAGPLAGLKVVELAGIGPGPWCGMLLSDLGAEVLRVDRPSAVGTMRTDLGAANGRQPAFVNDRGRRSIAVDLKHPRGAEVVLRLVEQADVLIEGNRPGVAERLGVGPEDCFARNPGLVYGRATGWGQDGPLSQTAGHDLNYLATSGLLAAIGPAGGAPAVPLNLLGDYAGGGLMLAMGLVAALWEARNGGPGQVVDASMLDGIALLGGVFYGQRQAGMLSLERGGNTLDGGAPFYTVYETVDGGWMAVAAIEAKFFSELLDVLGLPPELAALQWNRPEWPSLHAKIADVFRTRPRSEWESRFDGREACTTPVLDLDEALHHEHATARASFVPVDGVLQPAPAPRFSRTPGAIQGPAVPAGADTDTALHDWGLSEDEVTALRTSGAVV
ncbi:CaiB/BaiF CoA transferase family protein [Amycolatopsis keratiniphila]|uniref:Carnitine dehydratase n=1 Tax=Amycolatopsis keratiniphila subsp. keratiniphila TaxID=227715 RepID=A0A1W2M1I8_9PSEU|nr:CaiB/BaiF CoA-transferase family protein [Amycolatopsis keratiniphila]ONF73721.1 carnitine dehydratase [Amycolatopsis keratiniphila subsp. keratiniphila]